MGFQSGLSALIRLGVSLELDSENTGGCMTALSIGCPGNSLAGGNTCELQIAGKFLLYAVSIRGEAVVVSVALLDGIADPEVLLRTPDTEAGWELIFKFISSLEKYEVKNLERPIQVGDPAAGHDPETCWIIG